MKRDMDLVRKILLLVEQGEVDEMGVEFPRPIENYTSPQIEMHLTIMEEAELIKCSQIHMQSQSIHLTWQGHEFIELSRKDTFWEKAKNIAKDATGGLALEAVKTALVHISTQAIQNF